MRINGKMTRLTTKGRYFVSILALLASLLLDVVGCATDDIGKGPKANDDDGSIPDVFDYLRTRDKFRLKYEVNAIIKDKGNKASVLNSGRILIDSGGQYEMSGQQQYNIFYWFRTDSYHENYWLRPFVCASARTKLEEEPFKHGLLTDMVASELGYLASFTEAGVSGFNLQGLAAIFGHSRSFGDQSAIERSQEPDTSYIRDVHGKTLSFKTKTGYLLDFYFPKLFPMQSDASKTVSVDLSGIEIRFSADSTRQQQQLVGQAIETAFTLLKADYGENFPNEQSIFHLPAGYSCRRNIVPSFPIPASSQVTDGSRMKYTYEVNVILNGDQDLNSVPTYGSWSLPSPVDSLHRSRTNSSQLVLLNDQFDQYVAVISPTREDDSFNKDFGSRRPSLTVWDFRTKRKHLVHGQSGTCDEPVGFESTLFAATQLGDDTTNHGSSNDQLVELQLSERISLRLDEAGLDLMTFSIQDRKNFAQLVEMRALSPAEKEQDAPQNNVSHCDDHDSGDVYELTYEMPVHGKISLVEYDSRSPRPLTSKGVRLISKYTYSRQNGLWTPKSSSLLFFNEDNSKLMMLIEINLLHVIYYEPWTYSRHLVDLSACKRGYKQSARLEVEFPLTQSPWELQFVSRPHKFFRYSLASHLSSVYKLSPIRLPSIEVRLLEDRVLLEAHLLDQSHLLADSMLLPLIAKDVSKERYSSWLRHASRSTVTASTQMCAEYCQQYNCEVYTYCRYSLSCYIFLDGAELGLLADHIFGSISLNSGELECAAYKVMPARREPAASWRKNSWSLEEVLESFVESVVGFPAGSSGSDDGSRINSKTSEIIEVEGDGGVTPKGDDDLIEGPLDLAKLRVAKPFIRVMVKPDETKAERVVKLWPTFASYHYDNLQSNSLVSDQSSPFVLEQEQQQLAAIGKQGNQHSERLHSFEWQANYQIALGGFKLVELASVTHSQLYQQQMTAVNLDANDGYLAFEEYEAEDCSRMCSSDASCASFSYCTTSNSASANCIISRLNQTGIDRLWSSLAIEEQGTNETAAARRALQEQKNNSDSGCHLGVGLLSLLRLEMDPDCTIVRRTFMDQFEKLGVRMLSFYLNQSVDEARVLGVFEAKGPEDCANICVQNRAGSLFGGGNLSIGFENKNTPPATCLSYDFCQPIGGDESSSSGSSSSCVLFSRHLVGRSDHLAHVEGRSRSGEQSGVSDDLDANRRFETEKEKDLFSIIKKQTGQAHSYCVHFVRNFLADFHRINNRKLPPKMRGLLIDNYDSTKAAQSGSDLLDDNDDYKKNEAVTSSPSVANSPPEVHFEGGDDEISLARCAQLCEEDPDCGAFEFCLAGFGLASDGLLARCALGSNETLELAPTAAGSSNMRLRSSKKTRKQSVEGMLQLVKSRACSVYVYKSLSLVLAHKKKNLQRLAADLTMGQQEQQLDKQGTFEHDQSEPTGVSSLLRIDLWLMALVCFLFGFWVRSDVAGSVREQFSFQRLRGPSSTNDSRTLPAQRVGNGMITLELIRSSGQQRQPIETYSGVHIYSDKLDL